MGFWKNLFFGAAIAGSMAGGAHAQEGQVANQIKSKTDMTQEHVISIGFKYNRGKLAAALGDIYRHNRAKIDSVGEVGVVLSQLGTQIRNRMEEGGKDTITFTSFDGSRYKINIDGKYDFVVKIGENVFSIPATTVAQHLSNHSVIGIQG